MDLCKLDIVVEVATMALKVGFFMSRRNHFVTYTGAQHFYLYDLCVYVYS